MNATVHSAKTTSSKNSDLPGSKPGPLLWPACRPLGLAGAGCVLAGEGAAAAASAGTRAGLGFGATERRWAGAAIGGEPSGGTAGAGAGAAGAGDDTAAGAAACEVSLALAFSPPPLAAASARAFNSFCFFFHAISLNTTYDQYQQPQTP